MLHTKLNVLGGLIMKGREDALSVDGLDKKMRGLGVVEMGSL